MRVLFDNQIFSWQKFGGISRYIVELMSNLENIVSCKLPKTFSDNVYLKNKIILPQFKGKNRIYTAFNRASSIVSLSGDFDILHPTYYNPYFLKHLTHPYVITVHDMIHERFSEQFINDNTTSEKKQTILNAEKIIAISEHTKNDIIDIYGINPEKIDVVYHGVTLVEQSIPKYKIPKDFILFTGQRNGYKNFKNLCIAFSKLVASFPNLKLVCTGSQFSPEELLLLTKIGIKDKVIHIFASESELAYLYKNALCFVYPSIYEGFGIPILEAYGYKCPLCLSKTSCFPEIASNGGSYFDPLDPDSIALSIERAIVDDSYRKFLIHNGQKRLENFSWRKMANETLLTYKRALGIESI